MATEEELQAESQAGEDDEQVTAGPDPEESREDEMDLPSELSLQNEKGDPERVG